MTKKELIEALKDMPDSTQICALREENLWNENIQPLIAANQGVADKARAWADGAEFVFVNPEIDLGLPIFILK